MHVFHFYYLFIIFALLMIMFYLGRMSNKKQTHLKSSLHEIDERLTSFFSHTSEAINITNLNDELIYVNPSFEKLYGWKKEELIGKRLPFIPEHLWDESQSIKKSLLKGNTIDRWEAPFLRKDGTTLDVNIAVSPLRDFKGKINGFAAITRDISERKEYERRLKELAFFDPLTGVGNRRYFYSLLEKSMEIAKLNGRSFALLYLDCDNFKWVNDTMGHTIGDELLQKFTERIQTLLPPTGSIYRLGGDEFAIILSDISTREDISLVTNRIIDKLQTPWNIQEESFKTSCSIGISIFPIDGEDQQTLISNADHALYQAKAAGRNRLCFYSYGQDERKQLVFELEKSIEKPEFVAQLSKS